MSACLCDYEMPSVSRYTIHTARKQHRCCECGGAINHGEKYESVFGVWEGDARVYKTCSRCLEIRRFVIASIPCFCWGFGNLHEDAENTAEEYRHEADGLWFGTMRRILIADRAAKPQPPQGGPK